MKILYVLNNIITNFMKNLKLEVCANLTFLAYLIKKTLLLLLFKMLILKNTNLLSVTKFFNKMKLKL